MNTNRYLALFTILFGTGIFYEARKLTKVSSIDPVGSSLYPSGLAICIIFLGILLFVLSSSNKKKEHDKEATDWKAIILIIAMSIVNIVLLDILGFVITTIIFLIGVLKILGETNWRKMLSFSVGMSVILYALFKVLLGILLPPIPFL